MRTASGAWHAGHAVVGRTREEPGMSLGWKSLSALPGAKEIALHNSACSSLPSPGRPQITVYSGRGSQHCYEIIQDLSCPVTVGRRLDDKYAALRGALPDGSDCRIGRRIVPLTRLLHAVESDYHDAAPGGFALERLDLAAANDVVVIERRQRSRDLFAVLLYGSEVGYFGFRD